MRTLIGVIGAAALVGATLTGCSFSLGSGPPVVDKSALQSDISERLSKLGESPESVTCKDDLVGEVGKTARCEVVISATNSFEPVVTVTGAEGSTVKYDMNPAVSKEQLQTSVATLLASGPGADVDSVECESGLDGKKGAVSYCDVTGGGVTVRRTVEVTGVSGLMMNFDVIPMLTQAEVEGSLLDELERQVGTRPDTATCAGGLEGKPGNTVECSIITGPDTQDFLLTVDTVDGGKINYSYAPQ